jgi:basic amino acid/polyamine antiporter, APA family
MSRSSESSLARAVGVWGLAAGIVNVTVGGGIFRMPAGVAAILGPAAPVAYLICAAAMGLIVLCFAEAGSRVSLTGGLYAYVEVAFGPFAGFLTGALLWAGMTTATAAVSSFFADALVALLPAIGTGTSRAAALVFVLVGLALLNVAGVRGANRFNAVMTIAKLLPLFLLVVIGATAIRRENLVWHAAPPIRDVTRASTFLLFAFLGVESALVPSGEVRNPARTVPRAIFYAMVAVTLVYTAVQLVTQGILGAALATQQNPLAEAAGAVMGGSGRRLILVGTVVSMFGYVSGMTLAVPRMLFAFGRDGRLPASLAAVHSRFRTPYVAIAVQTVIVIVLAVTGRFEKLAIIANGSILLVYAACCAAVVELRRRNVREADAPFRVRATRLVPLFAGIIIVWLLSGLARDEWMGLGLVIIASILTYLVSMWRRRAPSISGTGAAAS